MPAEVEAVELGAGVLIAAVLGLEVENFRLEPVEVQALPGRGEPERRRRRVDRGRRGIVAPQVRRLLPDIEKSCCEYLSQQGADYGARAELTEMYFTTREYENVTLPAGDYLALRITLGSGEGHNWWCVMFPPLCIPMASEPIDDDVIPGDFTSDRIEIKFAVFEFFRSIFG